MNNTGDDNSEPFVLVHDAPTQSKAELVCASLRSLGLRAILQNEYRGPAAGWLNYLGVTYGTGVLVPASEVDDARQALEMPEASEADLLEAFEADGSCVDEAEARVK